MPYVCADACSMHTCFSAMFPGESTVLVVHLVRGPACLAGSRVRFHLRAKYAFPLGPLQLVP